MENTDTQNQNTDETDDNFDDDLDDDWFHPSKQRERMDNHRRQELRQAHIGNLVFSLRKSITDITSAKETPLVDLMENNARALNAAFEYYLDNACKSPEGDRKIALGLRAHAQMVRAINTWDRLRTSKYEGTN